MHVIVASPFRYGWPFTYTVPMNTPPTDGAALTIIAEYPTTSAKSTNNNKTGLTYFNPNINYTSLNTIQTTPQITTPQIFTLTILVALLYTKYPQPRLMLKSRLA
jgi:hypothetical protein